MSGGRPPITRTASAIGEQRDYLFMRKNPSGLHFERWRCDRGCGKWFNAARDTVTMEFRATYGIREEPPAHMTRTAPYRLPHAAGLGRLIDRNQPLAFAFDGQPLSGYAGDTLASALLANGRRLIGRSFKYHRPRGIVGLGAEEMNALIGVGRGAEHEPNLQATRVELEDGSVAVSQNRWPSLSFDIGQINDVFSRFIPGGFYYKTFIWPRSFWHHLYEPVIRRAAGLGRAPTGRDPAAYEQIRVDCDVLVVGGGPSGLAAAAAAAATGARVISPRTRPASAGSPISYDGGDRSCAPPPAVMVLTRTTALAHFHHNYSPAGRAIRIGDGAAPAAVEGARQGGDPGDRRHRAADRLRQQRPARRHAGGSSARLCRRYGVAPGERGVVFTNNDDGLPHRSRGQASGRRRGHVGRQPRAHPEGDAHRGGAEAPASRSLPAAWCLGSSPAPAARRSKRCRVAPYRAGMRPAR